MQLLAVADIHGRPDRLRHVRDTLAQHAVDALVVAGDLCRWFRAPATLLKELQQLRLPVMVIRGNSDPRRLEDRLGVYSNITSLHLKAVAWGGVSFVGAGGTVPLPFASRLGWSEGIIEETLCRLLTRQSVLVVHPPPRGVLDRVAGRFHAGCRTVSRVIAACRPQLVLCGHIHEQPGVATLGDTVVVNCTLGRGRGALVRLAAGQRPRVRLL
ncbi:MAG: metallophosphoesterase family protein [Deltaproteobacteria bacterium]|nr:metallophosphoesterase family protein [Deltaproteobacteria bacterium]